LGFVICAVDMTVTFGEFEGGGGEIFEIIDIIGLK
jgi:hypothetical protein